MTSASFVTDLKAHVREGVASTIEYLATPTVSNPPDQPGEFSKWHIMTSRPNWKTANVVLAFAVLSSSLLLTATKPADGQQPKPDAAEANIGNWIKGLGSADYQQREQATQSLTEAGAAAIGELIVAGFSDDAEVLYIQDTRFSEEAAEELRKTVQTVHTGRAKRIAAKPVDRERITMVVRVSQADIKRAEAEEFKDAFAVTNRAITDLIRAQARPKCIELGYDPNNIGLPRYSDEVAKFKKDERGYSGQITFDLYDKR